MKVVRTEGSKKVMMKKKRMNTVTHYVVLVVTIMGMTNSGYAAMYVKDGFMASVLKSPLLGLSILNTTNAQAAPTTRGSSHEGK